MTGMLRCECNSFLATSVASTCREIGREGVLPGVGVCAGNRVGERIRETKKTKLKPRMPCVIAFGVLVVNAVKQIYTLPAQPVVSQRTDKRTSGRSFLSKRTAERFAILLIQSECVKQEHRCGSFSGAACLNPFVAV